MGCAMKRRVPKISFSQRLLRVVLLAIVCIGSAELAACRIAEPALYQCITAPAFEAAQRAAHTGSILVNRLRENLSERRKEYLESQLASEPAIEESYAPPAVTALNEIDGQSVLTGGNANVVFYNQKDSLWAESPYGTDDIGGYGCGPTVMSMLVSSLTTHAVNPAEMAEWAAENGYWVASSGSRHSIVEGAAKAYGLKATPFRDFSVDSVLQELSSGNVMVALMSKGHFTDSGHFILLRGTTLDGKILVADPNSTERSLMPWDPLLILNELSTRRDDGSPLWTISC